jgi:hypothetical protein
VWFLREATGVLAPLAGRVWEDYDRPGQISGFVLPHVALALRGSLFSRDPQPLCGMFSTKQQENSRGSSSGEYLQKFQWRSLEPDPRYQHGARVRSART